jgi:integrase
VREALDESGLLQQPISASAESMLALQAVGHDPCANTAPYLYTEEEIQRLLTAAKSLSSASGLRPWTYHCLFGLLAVSGLRISEAIKLERQDVDFNQGLLTIYDGNALPPLSVAKKSRWQSSSS